MTRSYMLFSILLLLFTVPLLAQDDQGMSMTLPQPLNDDFYNWMIGEWQGTTTSINGVSQDYMKCEMEVGGQFLVSTYKAAQGDKLLMSGLAIHTLDKDGNEVGYWIDSWRQMAEGHGNRQGNVSIMKWPMAGGVYTRTTERVDQNTMKVTGVMTMTDGMEMKSETVLKRIN